MLSYALFPQVARSFLERRAQGNGGKEEVVAAIGALLAAQEEKKSQEAALPYKMMSPWKVSWRPTTNRWGGLLP